MRIAISTTKSEEGNQFMRQLGLTDVVNPSPPSPQGVVEYDSLMRKRRPL